MLEQILYTACVTPFDKESRKIDYHSLEKLLRTQKAISNGIVLLGSTGEGLSLSDEEKKSIIEFACKLKLDIEILVGVPSYNFHTAMEWLEFCNDLPIHGYLMTTPIYTKPGIIGQTRWFEQLLNKATHPAMLYNIPSRAGVKLYSETIKNLKGHHNMQAIKDSSGTIESIVEYKIVSDVSVYCGDDYMMPSMAIAGAAGLVSVISNAWPTETRHYVKHCLEGKKITDKIWWQACKALFTASNPIPVKVLLKDLGIIKHDAVRLPLSLEDLPSRQKLLEYQQVIKNWR